MAYQQITEIPSEIGQLRNLTYLSLCGCPISWVPQSLTELKRLEQLWLSGQVGLGLSNTAILIGSMANLCRLEEARRTCRAFMWVRKVAGQPYCSMPKEISRMICIELLQIAKKERTIAVGNALKNKGGINDVANK